MSTRTCKNCGWEYPRSFVGSKCTVCGQRFDEILCKHCKRLLPTSAFDAGRLECKECRQPYNYEKFLRAAQKLHDRFDEWVDKVQRVPKDYPTLTEAQWLEACRHFDGCARCSSQDIDSRGFFIDASLGGRYCDWNVIPLCEKCANTWDLTKSVFYYTEKRARNARSREYTVSLNRIVEYLGGKLDNAVGNI